MAGPLPGGDKQALIDAYGAAKSQSPDAGADPNVTPTGDMQQDAGDPAMKSLELQVQHLEHLLVQKGVISPTDLITPPAPMAPPAAPPMGAPPMGTPPGPPMQ